MSLCAEFPSNHSVLDDHYDHGHDHHHQQPCVIVVAGVTGAGKSHFIAALTGDRSIVGDSLHSFTQGVTAHRVMIDGREVILIDTPGNNDTSRSDTEILALVATWMTTAYRNDVRVAGVIYVHDLSHVRMDSGAVTSINTFKEICGEDFYKNVVFVSNRWDRVSESEGYQRLEQLKSEYWGIMLKRGAIAMEYKDCMTAKRIVSVIVKNNIPAHPKLGREMEVEGKTLLETGAGKVADKELAELREQQEKKMADLQRGFEQALKDKDHEMMKEYEKQKMESKALAEKIDKQADLLRNNNMEFDRLRQQQAQELAGLKTVFEQTMKNKDKEMMEMHKERAREAQAMAERIEQQAVAMRQDKKEMEERYMNEIRDVRHQLEQSQSSGSECVIL